MRAARFMFWIRRRSRRPIPVGAPGQGPWRSAWANAWD